MTTDISRKTFDHRRNTTWTTTMQGRVATDAPINEDRRIRDRRLRAETVDLIGRCGYPSALPTSFEITVSGGDLEIGPGRYYVDGHLAENFGTGTEVFNEILSEMRSPDPVDFDDQPYLPGADPFVPADGLHLIYLDVWQRDVTFLEDESILDPGITVDTFARRQTVWQVKAFGPVPNDTICSTPDADIPNWPEEIAPSVARLSSRADPAQAETDPCLLPPDAAYRGIDNRTYLAVVHGFDQNGTPLIKYSKTHGTVATTILSQPQGDVLEVAEVAKDDFLRFNPGDWVEITDEPRLLAGESGTMAKVLTVDDPTNTITLENALPANAVRLDGAGPDLDQQYHPVIRRWDQSGQIVDNDGNPITDLDLVGSSGLIPMPTDGTWIALKDGVEISMTLAAGTGSIRIGDRWTFIARYADNSVEELNAAPPEDFQHHYCRLALVEASGGNWIAPAVSDCRDPIDFAGDCCCTVVVQPGEDIQAAIDSLPDDVGGCVCLKAGLHNVSSAVRITTPNVVLHGESPGVTLAHTGDGTVLEISGTTSVRVSLIRFEHQSAAANDLGILEVISSADVAVTDCAFFAARGTSSAGVVLADASNIRIEASRFEALVFGILAYERCDHIEVIDNSMTLGAQSFVGQLGISAVNVTGPVRASGNRISGAITGISINDDATGASRGSLGQGSEVSGNEIDLMQTGASPGDTIVFFGIDTGAGDCLITGNRVSFIGSATAGIRASGIGTKITQNVVEVNFVADDDARNVGIFLGNGPDQDHLTEHAVVAENTLRGVTTGIFVGDTRDVLVSGNEIDPFPTFDFTPGIFLNEAIATRVSDNAIRGSGSGVISTSGRYLRLSGNTIADTGFGVALGLELAPTVANNSVTNAALFGVLGLLTVARTSFTENHLSNVGWFGPLPFALGTLFVLGEWQVEANEVIDTGVPIDGAANNSPTRGILGAFVMEARIESNLVTYSNGALLPDGREDRALLIHGLLEFSAVGGPGALTLGFPCQITNNKFTGKGLSALVEILELPITETFNARFERVFFNHNYCWHLGPGIESGDNATVVLEGSAAVVMGNQIKTMNGMMPSVNMGNMPGTVVGNITTAGFADDPNFPANEADFNRQL
ncbi:DUF6519 domain-containing protein [Marimonas sp. MJW-29]|uniref:DUF6519 domain-containing protein n=1 Tax=Sulfitobacter sediminis TaxID=3234186 RepID=A0ABV3RQ29_9RHOB